MEDKEILFYFEQALKHWGRPAFICNIFGWNNTESGLCNYFIKQHNVPLEEMYALYDKWNPYRTVKDRFYDFNNRKERVQAINKVIADLKKRIK